ncbi:nitroreductase family protein [Candidatus Binatus soli]|jgi:nitroreductase|uniref:nitroreductase family protein n=1 Tax=Candidatus Binatus soli TaxID=1953413 RepID=UPI003D10D135
MHEIGLFEAMYSARAIRRFKPDPVPEEVITKVLDAAIRAPSAGNSQNWAFLVVRDQEQRGKLAEIYRKASDAVGSFYAARGRPAHMTDEQFRRFVSSGMYLWDHIGEAPVLLVACLKQEPLPPPDALPAAAVTAFYAAMPHLARISGASIYPAVQNIILACRALGLGTVMTTNHILYEHEVKEVLGLPTDVETYTLMPIGYPHNKFGPVSRRPVSEVAYADRWGNSWRG